VNAEPEWIFWGTGYSPAPHTGADVGASWSVWLWVLNLRENQLSIAAEVCSACKAWQTKWETMERSGGNSAAHSYS
jgi:hypothetical protein